MTKKFHVFFVENGLTDDAKLSDVQYLPLVPNRGDILTWQGKTYSIDAVAHEIRDNEKIGYVVYLYISEAKKG